MSRQREKQVRFLRTPPPTETTTPSNPCAHYYNSTVGKRQRGHCDGRHFKEIHHHCANTNTTYRKTTLDTSSHRTNGNPASRSRRTRQRHTTKAHRTWQQSLHRQRAAETSTHTNALQRSVASICLTLQKQYKLRLNINQTPFQNAVSNIVNTPASKYFSTSKLAFHDLTDQKIVPPLAKSVLGLGFKFICTPPYTTGDISPNTARFERNFQRKVFFATPTTPDTPNKHHKLYVKSLWSPPLSDIPTWVDARLSRFFAKLRTLFEHRKAQPNLLPFQRAALRNLRNDTNLVFPDTDKGLGPCAVTYDQYIRDALVHLKDPTVFKQLSKEEAWAKAQLIENNIRSWLTSHKKAIDKDAANYIEDHLRRNRHAPFGKFYTTYKIHKQRTPTGFPTRPVCSDVTSLPHGLGKWVDTQLQPVAKAQPSYFQDSYSLKKLLSNTDIPPNALLFTADAKSMYTNIRTGPALAHISHLLRQEDGRTFHHYDTQALIEAVELVFTNNILQFGDTYWQQVSGTGMGIAPAPPWATIYYALHENRIIPRWTSNVLLYRRFIDDIIGVWVCDTCPERNNILWAQFKADMQQWHGLEWEFSGLS